MKLYKKPMITLDTGVAEGIYAASGADSFSVKDDGVVADWGGSGQRNFSLDLSTLEGKNVKLSITFNMPISNGWGGGFDGKADGSTLTLTQYSSPKFATITVQTNENIKNLAVTSYSVISAHNN